MSQYSAVIWSGVEVRLLRALWEITAEDGGIPVQLGYEPDNPADGRAVMIVISAWSIRQLLGAVPVTVPAGSTDAAPTEHWRLGYISRTDPNRESLWQSLQQREDLRDARLALQGHDWWVRVHEADPNDPEADIPF